MAFFLYGLEDPLSGELRYIGWTVRLEARLRRHMNDCRLRGSSHRENWLRSLKESGLSPVLVVLACRQKRADILVAEREAIQRHRDQGCDLVNTAPGGEGGATFTGRKHSAETLQKMSAAQRGHAPFSAAARTKVSAATRERFAGRHWILVNGKRVWTDEPPPPKPKRTYTAEEKAKHAAYELARYARKRGAAYRGKLRGAQ